MVGTENCWPHLEHFAWQLHNHHPMNGSLEIKQHDNFPPCINDGNFPFSTHMGVQEFTIPPLPSFRVEQKNVVHGSHQCLSPRFENSLNTPWSYQKEKEPLHSARLGATPVPKSNIGSLPKGFRISDQSGNQRRSMYSSVCPPSYIPFTVSENNYCCGWLQEDWAAADINSVKYFSNTLSNENHVADETSEMHENTEEIDALLYSDDDSIDYSSDDEVTSTGHSPELINECCEKEEQCQEITAEVASSDGPRKRQRVHDVEYIKSLPTVSVTCQQVDELEKFASDAESSCGISEEEEDGMDFGFNKFSLKKDRIRETMRVLESLVPGAKGKDPLLVIDEAIDLLEVLKTRS